MESWPEEVRRVGEWLEREGRYWKQHHLHTLAGELERQAGRLREAVAKEMLRRLNAGGDS
jgi:hypothetical protein